MLSNHLILSRPLLILLSVFPSQHQGLFSNDSSHQYWFDLLNSARDSQESSPVPQFESINSSALSLLMVQLSHLYMITGNTIALTIRTFVGKIISLLFNMLFRFVIAFLLSKEQAAFNFMLQSLSTVILESKKRKSVTARECTATVI